MWCADAGVRREHNTLSHRAPIESLQTRRNHNRLESLNFLFRSGSEEAGAQLAFSSPNAMGPRGDSNQQIGVCRVPDIFKLGHCGTVNIAHMRASQLRADFNAGGSYPATQPEEPAAQGYLRIPIGVGLSVVLLGESVPSNLALGLILVMAGVAAMTIPKDAWRWWIGRKAPACGTAYCTLTRVRSTNHDCGETKPLTFGLIARGLRSWTM